MKKQLQYINAILILVISAFAFIAGCQVATTPEELLEKASQLIEQGGNESAVSLLRPFIYHHKDNYRAHLLMGQAFLNTDAENDKSLYTARYYFNKARDLAANESQREQADLAYADVKLIMGKGTQSGEILLESAIRAGTMGRKGQAVQFCLKSASQFIEEEEYDDAKQACETGLNYTETQDQKSDLMLGLATTYFFRNEYSECLEILRELPEGSRSDCKVPALDPAFLTNAANLMVLKGKRKWTSLSKEFDENTKKLYFSNFEPMVTYFKDTQSKLNEKRAILIAESWLIIAEHSKDNGMFDQARQAYEFSRSIFLKASMEDRAFSVGEELEDFKS